MEYTYHRQYGYTAILGVHFVNLIYLYINLTPLLERPEFQILTDLQPRFFTCWIFLIQMLHAAVGLHCENLLRKNGDRDDYKLPPKLEAFRDGLFASILWPSTWVVLILFWTLCSYDTALVFQFYSDRFLNPVSNHIMHTLIVPMAFWELLYQRRRTPVSHGNNFKHIIMFFALYFCVIIYTYIERGIWIYPVFEKLYGTIYFPLVYILVNGISIAAYLLQWPLTEYFWRQKKNKLC